MSTNSPRAPRGARIENLPSRADVLSLLKKSGAPLSLERILQALDVREDAARDALTRRIGAMERDGQIIRNRRGAYGRVDEMDLVRGRVVGHRDGFGFLIPDEPGTDLYLAPRQMRGLMHGDRAVARVVSVDRDGRREGALVEVLERAVSRVVGRLYPESGIAFVRPHNSRISHDIMIPDGDTLEADGGDFVVAEIVAQPEKRRQPVGRVVEVLGHRMLPGMEIDVAIRTYELPQEFSHAALAQAAAFGEQVPREALTSRMDLRSTPLVTIDGEDARDFDDAVYCERTARGWKLLVAIADVSAYVDRGTPLDEDARERGNSVYFPDRVIPMLPEALSNGLCSLVPDQDRLALCCEMYLTEEGAIRRTRFFEAVIRSHARLTYTEVAAALDEDDTAARERLGALAPRIDALAELYRTFAKTRRERGAIELDATETRIVFGEDRRVVRLEPAVRNDAHRIIEECMIAANVAAARFLERHRLPVLFRVHEGPSDRKLEDLRAFLDELGLRLAGGDRPEPRHFAELLERTKERVDASLIESMLLRSLSQAVYAPTNRGHFGLAHAAYTHFTSPIRRYPDLLVHRAIKHAVHKQRPGRFGYTPEQVQLLGEHTSMTERRADEATRDAVAWLKCEFMLDKVGQEFAGTVTGATGFGVFVILDEVFVEGLIHVSVLGGEYFHFDPVRHRLVGRRSGKTFALGDRVRVRVADVNLDESRVDFEPAGDAHRRERGSPRRGNRRRRR